MIKRQAQAEFLKLLEQFPAVAILGPRQIGKTTLAEEIAARTRPEPVYLDLENPADLAKLDDPGQYFQTHTDRLIILDEIQRTPELFQVLRGVIDRRRRAGQKSGQFLILGSASLDLLKQSSESLAGRIAYKELTGLNVSEVKTRDHEALWLRGGFPDSFLASDDTASMRWRMNFISTYLERDVPQLGPRIPAVTLRRLWTIFLDDIAEPGNGLPEALKTTTIRKGEITQTHTRDRPTGALRYVFVNDSGTTLLDGIGLESSSRMQDDFSIHPRDPLKARAEVTSQSRYARKDWEIETKCRTVMTATPTTFELEATLDAFENGVRVFAKNWKESIPRDNV